MALFDDRLARKIIGLVWQRYRELGIVLGEWEGREGQEGRVRGTGESELGGVWKVGGQDEQEGWYVANELSELYSDLQLLIGVANGEYQRRDELVKQVEEVLTRVLGILFGNVLYRKVAVPDEFWKTEIGILVSRVRWWISVDELITISNAAALVFGENSQANRMRIVRAIDSGLLDWVPDPSVMNPQQNKRVLRPQVERLRDQRSMPD